MYVYEPTTTASKGGRKKEQGHRCWAHHIRLWYKQNVILVGEDDHVMHYNSTGMGCLKLNFQKDIIETI